MRSLRFFFFFTCCIATLAVTGCSRVHVGGDDAGGGGSDAGTREACGPVTCDVGQVCCNASCGICTDPGGLCTTIACAQDCGSNADCASGEYCAGSNGCLSGGARGTCVPRPTECPAVVAPVCGCDGTTYGNSCEAGAAGVNVASDGACGSATCDPDDAAGEGPCDAIVGIAWDGAACVSLSGCSCVGTDCGRYMSLEDCQAAHATCAGGCLESSDCPTGEWCFFAEVGQCGSGVPGVCTGPPPPGWACDPMAPQVCGCDGTTYDCENHAHAFATSVLHEGPCGGGGPCDPMDARGVGPECPAIYGVRWTGTACEYVGGCGCEGADCGNLYSDMASCEAATLGCDRPPGGSCGGFAGERCRPDEWCDYPDGSFCGGDDSLGACRPRPLACTDEENPVCGCDAMTYSNACQANAAGVDVSATGPCIVPG